MEQALLTLEVVADIFDGYQLADAWDEMFAAPGKPRASYDALVSVLQPMDPGELRYRADQLARVFTDRGVTYDYAGEERPFPLDLIPRVIDALEWDLVSRGVRQRVTALEALKISVEGLTRGIEHLGDRLADSQKLSAAELARLADQVAAGQRLIDARFEAMKELSARELDELKHGVRNIRQALELRPRAKAKPAPTV